MKKILVLYKSKYGSTKKYAQWISEELNCDIESTDNAKIDFVKNYDVIILGGGIYATGIAGISFLKKHYENLKNKTLIVFAVGASPYDKKSLECLKEKNLKDDLSSIPCFYLRGAWNEEIMSLKDRILCNLLKKAVSKKDPKDYEIWEKALMNAVGNNCDWTDKKSITPIIKIINS
jgi:menaquinone-dependent protoporphyrinogen IX oxidase